MADVNPDIPRSDPNLPAYLWHHRVHTQKAHESLYFWRIGFDPVYERDKVKAAISATCELHGVGGLVVYELLGVYDLLLRVWLPDGCSFDDFHESLTHELSSAGLSMLDPFQVEYMVRHWPFFKNGKQKFPKDKAIGRLTPELIAQVEKNLVGVDSEQLELLENRHLLARMDRRGDDSPNPGVKFVVMVSGSTELEEENFEIFEESVEKILNDAKAIHDGSMYTGSGFSHFLLMGRVGYDQDSFHAIHSELLAPLNAADLRERFRTRTVTHLGGQRGYSMLSERLTGKPARLLHQPRNEEKDLAEPEEKTLKPGEAFASRFEIKEDLGGGGFARVYRVHDIYERVDRALKLFKSSDPKMALREISALRKVNHPNVVKLLWGDCYGSRWFIVCEFIEGKTLRQIGELPPERSISIVIQVLAALQAVHPNDDRIAELKKAGEQGEMAIEDLHELNELQAKGLIHRDIKPENIMIRDDGQVVLVDFNIASPARQATETTSGTPAYFAPEGGIGGWHPTHDLFATGVVLYELLTGHHPFPQEIPVAGVQPIDPREYVPEMRESLALLLVRACSSIQNDRFQTASEMRMQLERELRILKTSTETSQITREYKDRRTALGITIDEFAAATGIDKRRLKRIESADTQPRLDESILIGKELDETSAEQAFKQGEELDSIPNSEGGGSGHLSEVSGSRAGDKLRNQKALEGDSDGNADLNVSPEEKRHPGEPKTPSV